MAERPLVLVIDDDRDLARMVSIMLAELAEVTLAHDGTEALEHLRDGLLPDAIVTDVMMPQMDGITLARYLKRDPKTARIPVIMLTAKNGPTDIIAGINAGARHYVTKPFKKEQLLEKVRRALAFS